MKKYLYILFLLITTNLFAQNEFAKWYFGNTAGLNFSTSPPTVLTNGAMNVSEGCATVSDACGNLLFYTDGVTVWNRSHSVMANGTGLLADNVGPFTTQAALIVKKPGSSIIYYVFTLDAVGGSNGLQYSVVDMSLAAGMGSVTVKNTLLHTPSTEKLTGVKHCNGTDIWVLTHDYPGNNFRAYLVTATGINTIAIVSAAGSNLSNGTNTQGGMKLSPAGNKLAAAIYNVNPGTPFGIEMYDFNNNTGIVSNFVSIYNATNLYYCEFSPDGSKLYASEGIGVIHQWDLCAGTNTSIVASHYTFTATAPKGMQAAPDGKIYVSRFQQSTLGIINNPNLAGAACNYVDLGLSITPRSGLWGLPNVISNSLLYLPVTYTVNEAISCQTASFSSTFQGPSCASTGNSVTAFSWSFGDPSSGSSNTSTLVNPVHSYQSAGTYMIKQLLATSCGTDTLRQCVTISALPSLSVTPNITICAGSSATIGASGVSTYTWSNGSSSFSIVVSPTVTSTYSVSGSHTVNTCVSNSAVTVSVLPGLSVTPNMMICAGSSATISASGASSYTWSNGPSSSSIVVSPTVTSTYSVSGGDTVNTCVRNSAVTVVVLNCTGISELQTREANVLIFPNPFSSELRLSSDENLRCRLLDVQGNLISEMITSRETSFINTQKCKPGFYVLQLFSDDGQFFLKAVKLFKYQ